VTETGTTDKGLTLSAILSFIDLSGAFSIYAKIAPSLEMIMLLAADYQEDNKNNFFFLYYKRLIADWLLNDW